MRYDPDGYEAADLAAAALAGTAFGAILGGLWLFAFGVALVAAVLIARGRRLWP